MNHTSSRLVSQSRSEGAVFLKLAQNDINVYEAKFQENLARLKNLSEGRDQIDEMRYDSLRIKVT